MALKAKLETVTPRLGLANIEGNFSFLHLGPLWDCAKVFPKLWGPGIIYGAPCYLVAGYWRPAPCRETRKMIWGQDIFVGGLGSAPLTDAGASGGERSYQAHVHGGDTEALSQEGSCLE